MAGQADMGQILGQQLLQAAQVMEEQVDDEIRKLERLDEDELEIIKQRRIGSLVDINNDVMNDVNLGVCRCDEEGTGEEAGIFETGTWRV